MSLKTLFGLEDSALKGSEIIKRIINARRQHQEEIEFVSGNKRVIVRINQLAPEGMMRGYQD